MMEKTDCFVACSDIAETEPFITALSDCIEVGGINFRADKALVDEVNSRCRLERSPQRFTRHISKYSPAERLALAQRFLESHAVLTVGDYVELTGLGRTVASMELRSWLKLPGSGIDFSGRGSHRVYVKKREE